MVTGLRALSSPSGGSLRRCSSFSPHSAWVEMILVTSKCQCSITLTCVPNHARIRFQIVDQTIFGNKVFPNHLP
ncbi:hypothetical protein FVEN_g9903 [Fusarium venenatum]|nr:hypothetical protein FVEN_g9903 [Fusarium venenatum]